MDEADPAVAAPQRVPDRERRNDEERRPAQLPGGPDPREQCALRKDGHEQQRRNRKLQRPLEGQPVQDLAHGARKDTLAQ